MAYFDFREDHTLGFFTLNPDLSSYTETRQFQGELLGYPGSPSVFNPFVSDAAPPLTVRRHTVDVQGAQATPLAPGSLGVPSFTPFRISSYLFGINPFDDSNQAEQLQVDAPDLPMFERGTVPFFGDYIDIAAAPSFLFQNGKWIFNTSSAGLPVFHTVWTDNRDVVPPSDGDWTHYEPPFSASNPSGGTHASVFDPTQTVTACQIGANDGFTASRNQNIYTSLIAPGLVVGSLGNSKPLGFSAANPTQLLQRAFTVTLRNTTKQLRSLRISIANQPALANGQLDPQGQASLLQFSLQTFFDVTIAPQSSVARAVFVKSANPTASVTVNALEVSAPGGALVPGGLQGFVTFNPDPAAPLLLDPDNFGFTNPAILSAETHNPAIANPAIANPAIANPAIANPAIANPAIANPAIANPAIANPAVVAALNPAIANPAIANPAIANPAIANPAIANQSVTDATYPVTNAGNTTTSYAVKLFQKAPLPAGVKLQLVLTKQYLVPVVQGCDLKQQIQNIVLANIPDPVFTPAASLGDPDLPDAAVTNATIALNPGETGQVIIRANVSDPTAMQNLLSNTLVPVAVAHPANSGVVIPSATLAILSSVLPDGVAGSAYNGQLNIFGGFGARTVSISSGALPPGLRLDASSGLISGTPTSAGSFPFTVQVTDSFTPPAAATQAVTLLIANPLLITPPKGADGIANVPYSLSLASTGGTGNPTWTVVSGTLPAGLNLSSAGLISGTPTQVSTAGISVNIQVADSANPPQAATASLTIHIAPVLTISTAQGPLPDAVVGQPYSAFTFQSTGGLAPVTWTVASGSLPTGLTLSPGGTISGTPTVSGSFSFTVQANDGSSPTQTITINVSVRSASLLVISTPGGTLPDAVQGVTYGPIPLQFAGGIAPQTWSVSAGALPPGMALSSSGVIGGVPAATGRFGFTAKIQDSGNPAQSAIVSLSIRVAAPLTITTPAGALPDAFYQALYSQTLTSSGGIAPIVWSLIGGHLPPGLTLSSAGLISGSATALGTFNFTVKAADSSAPQQSSTTSFSISVATTLSIVFTVQPSDTSSSASQITPAVKLLVTDNLGQSVRGATVEISLASNPTGASLFGQTVVTTGNNGFAVFSSLGVNKSGKGYTLKGLVTSPQAGAFAISVPFNVK
jgi:putative Ig domain-containing protein